MQNLFVFRYTHPLHAFRLLPFFIPIVSDFHVSPTTLSDHSFLSFAIGHLPPTHPSSLPTLIRTTKYTFDPIYMPANPNSLASLLHSFSHDNPVDTQTAFLITSLHTTASLAFPTKPHLGKT
ncbi:hypothetical protein O6H91_Y220200 [Diphasiastrum complanatum]|nr:hypothetical protein O6H91_Y220200 [Diphasiastrum complanatum]